MNRTGRTAMVVAVVSCAAPSLVGLASAQAFASPAAAVKISGYKVVEKTVSLPAGGFVRNTALCPAGEVGLGGGSAVVGAGTGNFGTEVQESSPGTFSGATSLWLAAVSNHSSTNRTLGIFAVCANKPKGYKVVEKTVSLPAGGFVRNTALDPEGGVEGGGGDLGGGGGIEK